MSNKKILCLVLAIVVCIQVISLSVFAATDAVRPNDIVNFILQTEAYKKHFDDYKKGEISEEQLQEYAQQYATSTGITLVGGATGLTTIVSAMDSFGIDVSDYWNMYYTGKTGSSGVPDVDMKGAGCFVLTYSKSDLNRIHQYFYCDYLVVRPGALTSDGYSVGNDSANFNFNGLFLWQIPKSYDSTQYDVNDTYDPAIDFSNSLYNQKVIIYGDVRYSDGTTASDISTDIVYTIPPLEEQDDDTLSDFLDELIKQLKYEYPDLSSIEGLLAAIHSELKLLDHDDDNSLLSTINNSILSLKTSIENLKIEGTENNFDFSNLFGDLNFKDLIKDNKFVVDIDLSDILSGNKVFSDNAFNFYFKVEDDYASTKFTELKDKFDSKFSFIDTLKDRRDFYFDEFKKLWSENNEGV